MDELSYAFVGDPAAKRIQICLDSESREVLLELAKQFRSLLLEDSDDSLERLYPPAYLDHSELNVEYVSLVHDDLLQEKLASIDIFESTIWLEFVEIEKFFCWMAVLNNIRLVLGTRLDVSEEDEFDFEKGHSPEQTLFVWLAMLLEEAVSASTFYVEDFNKR